MARHYERNSYYNSRRTVEFGGRAVHYVAMQFEPEQDTQESVLLVPGIMTQLRGMADLASELRFSGYDTITMSHDRIDNDCPEDVMSMIRAIKDGKIIKGGTEKLYVMAHSLGAIHSVKGMHSEPNIREYVDGVALMAPTGYGGVHPENMVWSMLGELARRPASEHIRDITFEGLRYAWAAKENIRHKLRDVSGMSLAVETQQLMYERDVPMTALIYIHDMLVKREEVCRGLGRAGLEYVFEVAGGNVGGINYIGHNAHLLHPEMVAVKALDALASLEDGDYMSRGATRLQRSYN